MRQARGPDVICAINFSGCKAVHHMKGQDGWGGYAYIFIYLYICIYILFSYQQINERTVPTWDKTVRDCQ